MGQEGFIKISKNTTQQTGWNVKPHEWTEKNQTDRSSKKHLSAGGSVRILKVACLDSVSKSQF
jgi:hypothetical protein